MSDEGEPTYVPTPDDLDILTARISATRYASEAVQVVEDWTREHWGVVSRVTMQMAVMDRDS